MLNCIPGLEVLPNILIDIYPIMNRKTKIDQNTCEKHPIFCNGENIQGEVKFMLNSQNFQHNGIKIELLGKIICNKLKGVNRNFVNKTQELSPKDIIVLDQSTKFQFDFNNIDLPFETYEGKLVKIKYFIIVTVQKRYFGIHQEHKEFIVMNPTDTEPDLNANTKMEVGIENFIQLEYEIFKSKFNLSDCVLGKIYFIKINIPVRTMEIHIYRKETIEEELNKHSDQILLYKYEIMDGSPNEKEIIPIRMYLDCYELTPCYKIQNETTEINVNYYLKFVLMDNKERIYFKQQELFLWRKSF